MFRRLLTELCRRLHRYVHRDAAHSLKPRRRGRRASTQLRASNESPSPAIRCADGSCPMSSGDRVSPGPARSPPSQLRSFQYQPEVLRVAGTESILVVVPVEAPVKPARYDTMQEHDPVGDGNHRDGSLSRNGKGYRCLLYTSPSPRDS